MSGEYLLAYLNPIFALSCALLLWILERRWPTHRYLFPLGLAFIYLALGFVSQDFLGFAQSDAIDYAGNGLFYGALVLACTSTLVRARSPLPFRRYALITGVVLAGFLWFALIDPSREARIYILGMGYAVIAGLTTVILVRSRPRNDADWLVVTAVGLGTVLALLRPAMVSMGFMDVGAVTGFNASEYWETIRVFTPLLALGVISCFLFAMAHDVHAELKRLAEQDFLSRLLNRRGFEIAVNEALVGEPGQTAALLLADIDDFKAINDSFGHKTGDEVIASIARLLSSHGRARLAGRIGGEEFALFYLGDERSALQGFAETVRAAISNATIPGLPTDYPLTISIGIHVQQSNETLTEMLIEADRALYRAKADGKDRAIVSSMRLHAVGAQPQTA